MGREFPEIVNFGTAFRFALEMEAACGDLAAAGIVLAPDDEWHDRLEVLVCTHDDRVQKLTTVRQEVNEMILEPLRGLDGSNYTAVVAGEPVTRWPDIVEQLAQAEDDTASFHEDFVAHADDVLAASARAFKKAAKQDRQAAEELREAL
jgi:Glycerophosphoryl diester phosphodiesterase family